MLLMSRVNRCCLNILNNPKKLTVIFVPQNIYGTDQGRHLTITVRCLAVRPMLHSPVWFHSRRSATSRLSPSLSTASPPCLTYSHAQSNVALGLLHWSPVSTILLTFPSSMSILCLWYLRSSINQCRVHTYN